MMLRWHLHDKNGDTTQVVLLFDISLDYDEHLTGTGVKLAVCVGEWNKFTHIPTIAVVLFNELPKRLLQQIIMVADLKTKSVESVAEIRW